MDSENKKYSKKKLIEIQNFIKDKYFTFKNIIQQTMISANHYKSLNIISSSNLSICNDCLELLFKKLKTIDYKNISAENFNYKLEILQTINNDLSSVFKKYGTHTLTDFMEICLDKNYIESNVPQQQQQQDHVNLLLKFFQPINYKSILWSNIPDDINNESPLMEDFVLAKNSTNFQCFSVYNSDIFKLECCGIKLVIHNKSKKRTLIVNGFINEISPLCIDNLFIDEKIGELYSSNIEGMDTNSVERYVMSLSLKDLLINTSMELMINLNKMTDSIKVYKSRSLMSIVKQFNKSSIMEKRRIIIELLIFKHECDFEYIAYLLYDMLTTDSNNNIDSRDQSLIYDSLPINFKKYFKEAMNNTLAYTEELYNFSNNVPLEQQICLMKVSDSVKEKAMVKLKEIKSKSDDSGSKARQYLEGLLRIPFNQYIKEEIMEHVPNSISKYNKISSLIGSHVDVDYKLDTIGTFIQLKNNIQTISKIRDNCDEYYYHLVIKNLSTGKKSDLIKSINHINQFFKQNHIQGKQLSYSGKTNSAIKTMISSTIKTIFKNEKLWRVFHSTVANELFKESEIIQSSVNDIKSNCTSINSYMQDITATLDESVYGHEKAKQQIKRIIGQWITGENNGYCFGFEGPPGVGKTSLAKYGISNCLKNTDGCSRPFSFIAIGGSSNGSTFEGHNYTYVGSTWGKIVDILMESKCMNPIIFIDELDKISKTENGKELIGILTHLIDSSQNDKFQDKYFNGIDIDVSKVLFIFSYNDVSIIDRILLDRIHRVKFDRLTIIDKIEITKRHLLKEISKKLGMENQIKMSDELIRFIVNRYTNESGVRKLKEILFEIYSEVNLELLSGEFDISELPIELTKETIEDRYLKDRFKSKPQLIHTEPAVGLINGLWANTLGMGGILSIETSFISSTNFLDLKLTGMQGDVMKESMNVAKTMAFNLLTKNQQTKVREKMEERKQLGIHIHCPDGATNKDGPSAGTAITMLIYSLFTNKKIKNTIAITGEVNLQGKVTAIGGLDLKIIGGIEAGVKEFIYPDENHEDFEKFLVKYEKRKEILEGITFHKVSKVKEVMKLVFV
jgi:ATP-dependent Lon protease